ncbi:MAG: hypothetical protein MNPFHGCM_01244 [Gemmatimonadaceae bacterium]|nr:hypothetical protein [Gemmatimonadaceae bacterium]
MSPVAWGVVVAAVIAALLLVLRRRGVRSVSASVDRAPVPGLGQRLDEVSRLKLALEEIELDRASGSLSERDYIGLHAAYVAALERAETLLPQVSAPDDAELLVARARAEHSICPTCGPRPEPSPPYCSSCGLYLRACRGCGERPTEIGARYCTCCGLYLAA